MLPSLEEVAKKRKILGLTQQKLARLAGVSQSLIAKLESQKIDPSYTKVKAIFDALERLQTETEVRAEEVLHSKVIGIQKSDPVSKAVQTMAEYGYSQLPVFDGEHTYPKYPNVPWVMSWRKLFLRLERTLRCR